MKKLQKEGLGETDQLVALTLKLFCSLRDGNTAKLKVNDIFHQPNGRLSLILIYEKNNQQ
ncbi:12530_t:CDS:2, partial [Racocetra fulgida]